MNQGTHRWTMLSGDTLSNVTVSNVTVSNVTLSSFKLPSFKLPGFIVSSVMLLGAMLVLGGAARPINAADRPLVVNCTVEKLSDSSANLRLNVALEIEEGWHAYDKVAVNSPYTTTQVTMKLPDTVERVGQWDRPVGRISLSEPEVFTYEGVVRFSHELNAKLSTATDIKVEVAYQVCRGQVCQPPTKQVVSVSLPATEEESGATDDFKNKYFEAPQRLMVGDKPLNSSAKQMYPSPAMYDVDHDGQVELVVGDIFGSLNVYEQTALKENGQPVWSEHTPLRSKDGQPIKVSNW